MYDCMAEERRPDQQLLSPANRGVPPMNAPTSVAYIYSKGRAILVDNITLLISI